MYYSDHIFMKKLQIIALSKTKQFARQVAKRLRGGEILGLFGPLGAGKTTFAKALGKSLGVEKIMPSPTFVLMHTYQARLLDPLAARKKIQFFHLDWYRAKTFREIEALGIKEFWGKKNTLTVIEWADKFRSHLPKKTKIIEFRH
jgi:tRNA threonylcarbamoyladenosine biosynthesis protein TsaE